MKKKILFVILALIGVFMATGSIAWFDDDFHNRINISLTNIDTFDRFGEVVLLNISDINISTFYTDYRDVIVVENDEQQISHQIMDDKLIFLANTSNGNFLNYSIYYNASSYSGGSNISLFEIIENFDSQINSSLDVNWLSEEGRVANITTVQSNSSSQSMTQQLGGGQSIFLYYNVSSMANYDGDFKYVFWTYPTSNPQYYNINLISNNRQYLPTFKILQGNNFPYGFYLGNDKLYDVGNDWFKVEAYFNSSGENGHFNILNNTYPTGLENASGHPSISSGNFYIDLVDTPWMGTNEPFFDNLYVSKYRDWDVFNESSIANILLPEYNEFGIESADALPATATKGYEANCSFSIYGDNVEINITWFNGSLRYEDINNTFNLSTGSYNNISIPENITDENENWFCEVAASVGGSYTGLNSSNYSTSTYNPSISINYPLTDYFTKNNSVNFTYISYYNNASTNCSLYLNNSFYSSIQDVANGSDSILDFTENNGILNANITCSDPAFSRSNVSENIVFTLTTTYPTLTWYYPLNNYTSSNQTLEIDINSSKENIGSLNASLLNMSYELEYSILNEDESGVDMLNVTFVYNFSVRGMYNISVTSQDRLNDSSNNSISADYFYYIFDDELPYAFNDSLSATTIITGGDFDIFIYTADDLSEINTVEVHIVDANGAQVSGSPFSMSSGGNNRWVKSYTTSATGTFNISNFTVTDLASNTNTTVSSLQFTVTGQGGSGGGSGGGGGTASTIAIECLDNLTCETNFGTNYFCKSNKCILRETGICNYNGMCEISRGEDIYNCGDKYIPSKDKLILQKGDCKASVSAFLCDDPTQPCIWRNAKVLQIITFIAVGAVLFIVFRESLPRRL